MEDPAPAIPLEKLVAHREWVRRVARALVHDESLADDLEQEVWLEAIEHPPRSGRSLGAWLSTAMRHNLLDHRRSESRRRVREEEVARPEGEKSVADLVVEAESHKQVVAAVLDLTEPYRGTILLRYFEDLSLKEVARRQGVPLETVRTRIRRAIELLRDRFDAERDGDRKSWCIALLPLMQGPDAMVPVGAGAGVAASASSAAVLGGVLMAKKAVAVLAVVLLLGWAGWFAFRPENSAPGPSSVPSVARTGKPVPTPVPPASPTSPASRPPTGAATAEALPTPGTGFRLKGKVVDALGNPVPKARIVSGALSPGSDPVREVIAVSGDTGEFSVHLQQRPGWVWAEAPGHASSLMATVLLGGAKEDTVVLRMQGVAGTIGGVVRTPSSVPVAGARMSLSVPSRMGFQYHNEGEADGQEALVVPVTTDTDGRYTLSGLAAGPREVMVECDGYASVKVETKVIVGETVSLDFRLPAGATVFGNLLTPEGAPAKGLHVVLVGMNRMPDRGTRTDETGAYRFENVPEGGVIVRATDGAGASFESAVGVRDGESRRLDGQLLRKRVVSGRLVDSRGQPLARWRVTFYLRTGARLCLMYGTNSNEEGRFEIRDLPPGDAVVGASPASNAPPRMIGLPQGETIAIDTSAAAGTVIGQLVGEEGSRNLSLRVMRRDDPTETWSSTALNAQDHRFRVELPGGEYLARVTTTDGGIVELPPVSVFSGTNTDVGVVDLSQLFPTTLVIDAVWVDRGLFTLSRMRAGNERTLLVTGNLRQEVKVRLGDGDYVIHVEGADIRPCEKRFTIRGAGTTVDVPVKPSPGVAVFQFTLPGHAGESYWITMRDGEGIVVFEGLVKVNSEDQAGWGMNVEAGRYTYRLAGSRVFEGVIELSGSPPTGKVRVE